MDKTKPHKFKVILLDGSIKRFSSKVAMDLWWDLKVPEKRFFFEDIPRASRFPWEEVVILERCPQEITKIMSVLDYC